MEQTGQAAAERCASILLVRLLALGDVLLTMPIIQALAASPDVAHVDLLTSSDFADCARRMPGLRTVFAYDAGSGTIDGGAPAEAYDLIADLHTRGVPLDPSIESLLGRLTGVSRTGFASPYAPPAGHHTLPGRRRDEHAVEYYARAVSTYLDRVPAEQDHLRISTAEREAAIAALPPNPVCLCPGARYGWKRWPASSYAALAAILAGNGFDPVIIGHPFDRAAVDEVSQAAPPGVPTLVGDMPELTAAMAVSGLVVANNSGLCALGSAAGAQVLCLHSHTLPSMWRPWGPGHANLTGSEADMPCDCTGPEPHDLATPCGMRISVEAAAEKILALAARPRPARQQSARQQSAPQQSAQSRPARPRAVRQEA